MSILRVFPRRTNMTPTDELAIVGNPGLFRPVVDEVHISVSFTWDIECAELLQRAWAEYYEIVKIGGPALGDRGNEFLPGRYLRNGVTITSRGCKRSCSFCFVPTREGTIRTLAIYPGNIIQDNNLLACPRGHIEKVFQMLTTQTRIVFAGGLDALYFQRWHLEAISKLSLKEMWFASDGRNITRHLERVADLLSDIPIRKKRCYVLIGYKGESISDATLRVERVFNLGFLPFVQFYRGPGEQRRTLAWSQFIRLWSRPAAMLARDRNRL